MDDSTLKTAAQVYSVANTPLFLLRKLREDANIRSVSDEFTGADIVDLLRQALREEPKSPLEAVRPYALLVALSFKPSCEFLQEAARLPAPFADWFPYIAEVLAETFSPVQSQQLQAPTHLPAPPVSVESSAPVIRHTLAAASGK